MTLPALLLAAVVSVSAQEEPVPSPAPETPEAEAAPAAVPEATATATGSASGHVEAGLVAFRKRRFREAERHFQEAASAEPTNAAAAFYLAYTTYKIAEPKRPFHPDKQRAASLFARAYELDPTFKPVWASR